VIIQIIRIDSVQKKSKIKAKFDLDISLLNYFNFAIEVRDCIELNDLNFESKDHDIQIFRKNNLFIFLTNNLSTFLDTFSNYKSLVSLSKDFEKAISNFQNFNLVVTEKIKNYLLLKTECFYNMGILNMTPDSFSDGGIYNNLDKGFEHALNLLKDGADIIDIGGESSRPGADTISILEESERVLPLIAKLLEYDPNMVISVDTTKAEIAEQSLKIGAKIINDISGFDYDSNMMSILEKYKPIVILMHTKGNPKTMQNNPSYSDVISEIYDYFVEKINKLNNIGVNKIILDPGIGFGKRVEDNFEIINKLEDFHSLGYPILIGLSKKSFLGKTTDSDVMDRDFESVIMETLSVNNGAKFIRTHNVKNANKIKKLLTKYQNYGG